MLDVTPPRTISAEGDDLSVEGFATDHAGNTTAIPRSGIRIDKTKPRLEFAPSTAPEQLALFIQSEVGKWRGVVQKSGAQVD